MGKRKLSFVSLYSGCGALDHGINKAGFKSLLSIEMDKDSCDSLRTNHVCSNVINKSIFDVSNKEILNGIGPLKQGLDLVVGGPPCQPYSKSRFYRKDIQRGMQDPLSNTLLEYFRVVKLLKPRMFLLENVPAIMYKRQFGAFETILRLAKSLGYETKFKILNAVDYGVPQKRERVFLVGHKKGMEFAFPKATHFAPEKSNGRKSEKRHVTAGDVLADLDTEANASDEGHKAGGKDYDLLKKIPPGENYLFFTKERGHPNPKFIWRSRYWSFLLKLSPNLPAWTIQARRSNNMGPLHWRNRILRIEEIKRLQTIPDNWELAGTVESQWKQIGNGVPCDLATAIGIQIKRSLRANGK